MPSKKTRVSRKNRKAVSRKNRKAVSRKNRNVRKNKRTRKTYKGGFMAAVNDSSMNMPSRVSLAQGGQYLNLHKGQYGGGPAAYPTAVTDSVLTGPIIASARTGPLDQAISQIQGMQDGGRRKGRKNKTHKGGNMGSPISENSMILPPGLEKQAALNYEWSAAKNPNFYAPK